MYVNEDDNDGNSDMMRGDVSWVPDRSVSWRSRHTVCPLCTAVHLEHNTVCTVAHSRPSMGPWILRHPKPGPTPTSAYTKISFLDVGCWALCQPAPTCFEIGMKFDEHRVYQKKSMSLAYVGKKKINETCYTLDRYRSAKKVQFS